MRRVWTDKLVRIAGSFTLLLLLAVQEKACPWLLIPPTPVERQTDADSDPTDESEGGKSKSAPLSLITALPDVMPARWPAMPTRGSLEETAGWRSGTFARGPLSPPADQSQQAPAHAPWPCWPTTLRPTASGELVRPLVAVQPEIDPALGTVLLRTGPPLA